MKTIFVSLASYRDKLCSSTINSLFENAAYPHNVYIGVCEQNDENDLPCMPTDTPFSDNIRMIKIDYTKATGPAYARYLCSELYNGEDFFFQVDSHCKFVKNWDIKLLGMMDMLYKISKKPILSHYPREYEDYEKEPSPRSKITIIKKAFVNERGIISFHGAEFISPPKIPVKSYFIAAGFIFAPGSFLNEVPFDPYLPNLFTGEEILLTLRAYTNGWDVYTPNLNIMYHYYTRSDSPKFWDYNYKPATDAEMKVKLITSDAHPNSIKSIKSPEIAQSIDTHGLGEVRTKEDFYSEVNIDKTPSSSQSPHRNYIILWICFAFACVFFITFLYFAFMKKEKMRSLKKIIKKK